MPFRLEVACRTHCTDLYFRFLMIYKITIYVAILVTEVGALFCNLSVFHGLANKVFNRYRVSK